MEVKVTLSNGDERYFSDERRAGGSWETTVKYEPGWVHVIDVWERWHSFPVSSVLSVDTTPRPRF